MTIALNVLLLVLFIIWGVMALVKGEAAGSDFWWKALIGMAVLAFFGAGHLNAS